MVFPLEGDVFDEFMPDMANKLFFVFDGLVCFGESMGVDALRSYMVLSRYEILLFLIFKPGFIIFLVTNIPRILSVDFAFIQGGIHFPQSPSPKPNRIHNTCPLLPLP